MAIAYKEYNSSAPRSSLNQMERRNRIVTQKRHRKPKTCRRLFSDDPVDHNQTLSELQTLREKLMNESSKEWNFDFQPGLPLPGRYQWTVLRDVFNVASKRTYGLQMNHSLGLDVRRDTFHAAGKHIAVHQHVDDETRTEREDAQAVAQNETASERLLESQSKVSSQNVSVTSSPLDCSSSGSTTLLLNNVANNTADSSSREHTTIKLKLSSGLKRLHSTSQKPLTDYFAVSKSSRRHSVDAVKTSKSTAA